MSLLAALACGPQTGARPLARVQKDNASLRSRTLLDLERSVVFPRCANNPRPAFVCGLVATREAEREVDAACPEPICKRRKLQALFSGIRQRADALGVDLRAIDLRCGAPCRDMRALELEVLRVSASAAEQRASAAYLRADLAEREALEREREDVASFVEQKKARDAKLETLFASHRRELLEAAREGASLPHVTLCRDTGECSPDAECTHFDDASVGLCQTD